MILAEEVNCHRILAISGESINLRGALKHPMTKCEDAQFVLGDW